MKFHTINTNRYITGMISVDKKTPSSCLVISSENISTIALFVGEWRCINFLRKLGLRPSQAKPGCSVDGGSDLRPVVLLDDVIGVRSCFGKNHFWQGSPGFHRAVVG